jgi:hypothetical protein
MPCPSFLRCPPRRWVGIAITKAANMRSLDWPVTVRRTKRLSCTGRYTTAQHGGCGRTPCSSRTSTLMASGGHDSKGSREPATPPDFRSWCHATRQRSLGGCLETLDETRYPRRQVYGLAPRPAGERRGGDQVCADLPSTHSDHTHSLTRRRKADIAPCFVRFRHDGRAPGQRSCRARLHDWAKGSSFELLSVMRSHVAQEATQVRKR